MRGSLIWRRRATVVAVATAAVVLAVLMLSGGEDGDDEGGDTQETAAATTAGGSASAGPAADLSTRDLVDQVLLTGFDGQDPGSDVIEDVADHQLGGVLIGAGNWRGAGPGAKLIDAIREAGSKGDAIPPLIATIQEGGPYRALEDLPPERREIEIGDIGDPRVAERWAEEAGKALRDVGIDLNLAPVADVATLDSPIADRAFSDDAAVAAQMTAAAITGCRKAKIACAVSHFPGLGAASQSTDAGPASVALDAAGLAARDLPPFRAAFDAGAPATVVSHALYGGLDPVVPASLSTAVTTDLLRAEIGFDGVAISDDIGAGAVSAVSPPADAAVKALVAGIALVQVANPADVEPVRRALLAALEGGTLSEDRLREAAGRVLALKRSL